MINWYKRMKPKLKNWRWWVMTPILIIYMIVFILPFVALEFLCEKLFRLSEMMNTAHDPSPNWLSEVMKWSESNDKHEER